MLKHINHGPVTELSIDRPPVNALNPDLVDTLDSAIRQAAENSRAIILTGREGIFSAGLDVPELMQLDHEGMASFWQKFFGLLETIARSPIPVVAAIGGHAPAGGAVISLFCDYRIMAKGEFVIGLNETRVGLLVPGVIRHALIRLVGAHRAERLIVAGSLLNPADALSQGLVDALSDDPANVVGDAIDWCQQHMALPGHAMSGNRELMRRDICTRFDHLGEADVAEFVNWWFEKQTQEILRGLLEQLKNKQ